MGIRISPSLLHPSFWLRPIRSIRSGASYGPGTVCSSRRSSISIGGPCPLCCRHSRGLFSVSARSSAINISSSHSSRRRRSLAPSCSVELRADSFRVYLDTSSLSASSRSPLQIQRLTSSLTPGTYQAAIVGAQAFIMLGLVCAFDGVWNGIHGNRSAPMLAVAGAMWALALACRLSVAPAVALFIVATALASSARSARRLPQLVIDMLAAGVPVLIGSIGVTCLQQGSVQCLVRFRAHCQMRASTSSFPRPTSSLRSIPISCARPRCRATSPSSSSIGTPACNPYPHRLPFPELDR